MRKSARPAIVFGEAGLKEIEYLGELPGVFGPFVTRKIYRFREGKNPRTVDVRDLPGLTKQAGRRKLRDVNEPEEKKESKSKSIPAVKPPQIEVEIEEVKDGTT